MSIESFNLIKKAVTELNNANVGLQEALTIWSESISDMHRCEINVRVAHRTVVKAQNLLTVAINNNLGEEIEKLKERK